MSSILSFHEVRFPTAIALGAIGGPVRRTEIVTLGSGHEQRNARWGASRRKYNAGYGVKTLDDLNEVLGFFEERRGKLFGFRYRDPIDYKSCKPSGDISSTDQQIGIGDTAQSIFDLAKNYGTGNHQWTRKITKPVANQVLVAVDGVPQIIDADYTLDATNGQIVFLENSVPSNGAIVSCGFEFDVPVRFDTDEILVNLKTFLAGDIASIPLIEVLI